LYNTVKSIKSLNSGSHNPNDLLKVIQKEYTQFSGRRQQDAHEVFISLIDGLKKRETAVCKESLLQHFGIKYDDPKKLSQDQKEKYRSIYRDNLAKFPVHSQFNGKISYLTKCEGCGNITNFTDDFSLLSLNLYSKEKVTNALGNSKRRSISKNNSVSSLTSNEQNYSENSSDYSWSKIEVPPSNSSDADDEVEEEEKELDLHLSNLSVASSRNQELMRNSLWNELSNDEMYELFKGDISIESLLVNNSRPEIMTGINQIKCDKCKAKQTATRMCCVSRYPEVFVLHLKRYKQENARLVKINSKVRFDEFLELQNVKYELVGVVEHSGTLNTGHYTSIVKAAEDSWYYCSDTSVKKCPNIRICNPYLLFYTKVQQKF